ncbi:hypothetical protein GCM10025768_01780 [Microbacterium pseudoresistens]|uniref:CN hydrolase domain-containing protein n=1 Tax=Microbacterium pseudoresistens TaxID=640634 RepID=A0A7Y9EU56_9MICO|nr:hypothetical protein [Microbacterium pseudoresistens]
MCYDLEFPEVPRALALAGADIIAAPVNWLLLPRPEGEHAPEVVQAMADDRGASRPARAAFVPATIAARDGDARGAGRGGNAAAVLNDMINSNLTTRDDPERMEKICASGIVESTVALVAAARESGIPIFWIQVERRADRADTMSIKTDLLHRRVTVPKPPVLAGSFEAQNIDELPIDLDDQAEWRALCAPVPISDTTS